MRGLWVRLGAGCAALAVIAGGTVAGSQARAAEAAPVHAAHGTVTEMKIGPFVLPPAPLGAQHGVNIPIPRIEKPCDNCYIVAVDPDMVFADGRRAGMADGVMLHHMVIFEPGKPDPTCGRSGVGALGRRIFAAGDERTPFHLPEGFGFPVDSGRWTGVTELMNHSSAPQTVFLTAKVTHVPMDKPGMKPVTPVWLDVANCSDSQYSVPAGKSATPWTWTSNLTGRIVGAGGHVHAGGIGLTLDNATTKQRICSSEAGYGEGAHAGMVTSMSVCFWDSLGTVRTGEQLKITSLYDTPSATSGVMGIMLLAIYETDDLTGGTKAPAAMRATPTTKVPAQIADDSGHGAGHGGPPHH
ncbi:MAG: hypothetical protein ACT4QG_21560 [Sporichthyaceae bacterium]